MKNGDYELVEAPEDYPGMRYRGKYCYEHHLVYWLVHGVIPGPDELIHHLNGNKRDNRAFNLELTGRSEHTIHHARQPRLVRLRCPGCGATFIRPRRATHLVRPVKFTVCSQACIAKVCGRGSPSRTYEDNVIEEFTPNRDEFVGEASVGHFVDPELVPKIYPRLRPGTEAYDCVVCGARARKYSEVCSRRCAAELEYRMAWGSHDLPALLAIHRHSLAEVHRQTGLSLAMLNRRVKELGLTRGSDYDLGADFKSEVTKEELQRLVWEMPSTKVAEHLGISDSLVGKYCKRFGIGKPPRGYWAKKKAGKI